MPGVVLAGVVDTAPGRAAEMGAACGAPAFTDWRDLRGQVDAVIVAVPTEAHTEIGRASCRERVFVGV